MSAKNKFKILTAVLTVLLPVFFMGLSRFSTFFAFLGLFCLFGDMLSIMVLINLCSRKRPNLILIGTLMFFFGVTLLSGVSGVTSLRIIIVLLSLVYITTGPFLVVKGIMNRYKKVETEYCALCGKNITKLKKKPLYEKDGEKFCSDCKEVIEKDIENKHIVCSICGIDLTADDMNVVDDSLFCNNCLSEKFGNIYSYM